MSALDFSSGVSEGLSSLVLEVGFAVLLLLTKDAAISLILSVLVFPCRFERGAVCVFVVAAGGSFDAFSEMFLILLSMVEVDAVSFWLLFHGTVIVLAESAFTVIKEKSRTSQ